MNFDKKTRRLKDNVLRSPGGMDEISVVRVDHCDINICRTHLKSIEASEGSHRKYWGFFTLITNEVRDVGSNVKYSPIPVLKQHADIVHGYVEIKDQAPPNDIRIRINKLLEFAQERLKQDDNPLSKWDGDFM